MADTDAFLYFCCPNFFESMEILELQSKVHDEAKQGEAYAPFESDPYQYKKRFYIESYGYAMNFSDSEIVASILNTEGFGATKNFEEADLVLLNTCSIREKAEQTVRKRLTEFKKNKTQKTGNVDWCAGLHGRTFKNKIIRRRKIS